MTRFLRVFAVAALAIGSINAQTLTEKLRLANLRADQAEMSRDRAVNDARVARAETAAEVAKAKLADAEKIQIAEAAAKVAQAKLDGQLVLNNADKVAANEIAKAKLETQTQAIAALQKELEAERVGRGVLEAKLAQLQAEVEKDTDAGFSINLFSAKGKFKQGRDLHKNKK